LRQGNTGKSDARRTGKTVNFIPRSIRGRLILASMVFTALALLIAAISVSNLVDRFARRNLNERLDGQVALLAQTVRPDGTLDPVRLAQIGPFTRHRGGWGWEVKATDRTAASLDIERASPVLTEGQRQTRHHEKEDGETDRRDGRRYVRTLEQQMPTGPVTISAWAPRHVIERMQRATLMPWVVALGALAAFLIVATLLQLRFGLRPLALVKQSLRDVRSGVNERLSEDQPQELKELVQEVNGLLDENEAALSRARGHAANLAHSLKTPLATLALKLREEGRDPDGELAALVAQADGAIRHHLGRARAASPGAPGQLRVDLRPAVAEMLAVLGRIHVDRATSVDNAVPPGITLKCDPQDLDEMLGNLLDNAWKWAVGEIAVNAVEEGGQVRIHIDDDGPGLSAEAIDQALVRGQRLDERDDGHGFGLPIARELAELHGGSLELGPSPLGGLRAVLFLPR
jgi:signal transduction histidine kinase